MQWVRDQYMKDFAHYFLPHFPYAMHQVVKAKKAKKTSDTLEVGTFSVK